ncbi:MAG: ABC transporter permease subunit [Oscillospiraceae bacterium]|jgi:sodium transport system permease protein|nr:ABC transporter permease subunit [Oscillospiraceae bacterium]
MRNAYFAVVLKKEILDMLRDRRALITNLVLPLVLYPVMFLFMGSAVNSLVTDAEQNTRLAVTAGTALYDVLSETEGLHIASAADPVAELDAGRADVALNVLSEGDGKYSAEIIFDDTKSASTMSAQYVISLLDAYNQSAVNEKLAEMGISIAQLSPVAITQKTLNAAAGREEASGAGIMLSMMLPMLVVIFLAVGGLATAGDLFAGEKERRTMEPLLCTRAGRGSILGAKFTAVTLYSLLSVVATFAGILLGNIINPDAMGMGIDTDALGDFTIPPLSLLLTVILIAVMAMVFSGLHVAVSTYSRTVKEAATYGTFFMLVAYIPVFSTMFMQAGDIKAWMMFVPMLNVVGAMKMVLGGVSDIPFFLGCIASSLVFLALVLALTRALFRKESVMLRTV